MTELDAKMLSNSSRLNGPVTECVIRKNCSARIAPPIHFAVYQQSSDFILRATENYHHVAPAASVATQ